MSECKVNDYYELRKFFEEIKAIFAPAMKIIIKNLAFAAILIAAVTLGASDAAAGDGKIYKGFSGGMMVHTGYLSGCDNSLDYNASGMTFGIGGVAKVHLFDHFRT